MDNPPQPYIPPASPSPHYQLSDLPLDILDKIIPTYLYDTQQLHDKLQDVDIRFNTLAFTEQADLDDFVRRNVSNTFTADDIRTLPQYEFMAREVAEANRLKKVKKIYEQAIQKREPIQSIVDDIVLYQLY